MSGEDEDEAGEMEEEATEDEGEAEGVEDHGIEEEEEEEEAAGGVEEDGMEEEDASAAGGRYTQHELQCRMKCSSDCERCINGHHTGYAISVHGAPLHRQLWGWTARALLMLRLAHPLICYSGFSAYKAPRYA